MTPSDPVAQLFSPFNALFQVGRLYSKPPIGQCGSCIIHDFSTFFAQSNPTAILSFSMSYFPFFRPTISSLGFSMSFAPGGIPTLLTTIALASPTTAANAKTLATPPALDFQQWDKNISFFDSHSGLVKSRKIW
jgi:hypothetical protein